MAIRCADLTAKKVKMGIMSIFNSKQLNLIIGIDENDYCLVIMRCVGTDTSSCQVNYIPVERALINDGKWADIFARYLPDYIESQHFDKAFAIRLVLPNRLVATDILTVPTLSAPKTAEALQVQCKELYRFSADYKINKLLLSSNKSNTAYELFMVNKNTINSIYKALSASKLYVRDCTYVAAAALNAVFALRGKTKKQNFLFLDIKSNSACISVCVNGNNVGWVEVPFGLNFLSDDCVNFESDFVPNDLANAAVKNAAKLAKKGKSALKDEIGLITGDYSAESKTSFSEQTDGAAAASSDSAVSLGSAAANGDDSACGESAEDENNNSAAQSKKNKKIPAFLKRPQPETPQEFVFENFRAFVKRCLLIKMQNEQSEYLAAPSFVLVNLPEEYAYLIDCINAEKDTGIEFRFFSPEKENNHFLTANLELYGALFTGFSKCGNF